MNHDHIDCSKTQAAWSSSSLVTNGIFGLVVALVGVMRFAVMSSGDAPPTIDSGNWLSFADSLLGNSPRDASITYPPVVPLLTELFTTLFGLNNGIAALAGVSSVAPAIGLYIALRMAKVGQFRIIPALLLLGAGSIGEATAWGGFPQLLGIAVLPLVLLQGIRYIDTPTRGTSFKLGLGMLALLATSHFVSTIAVASFAIVLAIDAVHLRKFPLSGSHLRWLPVVIGPSLPLLGIYVRLINAIFLNPNEFTSLENITWGTALQRLDFVNADFPQLWKLLVPLSLITPALTWSIRRSTAWRMSTSLMVSTLLLLMITREVRYFYIVPVFSGMALGVWAIELRRGIELSKLTWLARSTYRLMGLVALLIVILQLNASSRRFNVQHDYFAILNSGLVDAIAVSDTVIKTDGGAIAVPSVDDAPIGWWVEALTRERVIAGSPLRWLNFSDEVERASTANAIFHPLFPDRHSLGLLGSADVSVLILPVQWTWYDDDNVEQWIADNNLDVVERNAEALVVRVP